MFYCYKITNLINLKVYIGKTCNIHRRWNEHKNDAFRNNRNTFNLILYKSFRKYSLHNFKFTILGEYETEYLALGSEKYYINFYKSNVCRYGDKFGMNMTDGGESLYGSNNPMYGKHHSQKSIEQISKNRKGIPASREFKDKLSKIMSGANNPMFGRNHNINTIRQISKTKRQFSDDVEIEIYKLYESGNYTHNELSKLYNCGESTIGTIIKRTRKLLQVTK